MTIEDIYNNYKPIAIYKTGSSCFLENPHDKDIVLYYRTYEEADMARKNNSRIIVEAGYDPHVVVEERVCIGCYILHYMEKLIGEDVDFGFDFLDVKQEWLAKAKRLTKTLLDENKQWYRLLTGVYIYENNSYEFTAEQLANIQKVHDDRAITPELKKHIIDFIENSII